MSELNPYAAPQSEADSPLVAPAYRRPTVLGSIGRGTTLFVQCFPAVALITLTVWIPLELVVSYQEYFVLDPEDVGAAIHLSMLADAFVGIIATSGVISVGAAALRGERRSWLQGLGDGLAAWPRMFGTRFLSGILVFLALLLFLIPGIYLAVRFSLAESVAVIERKGGMYALRRSQELTRGKFWQFLTLSVLMIAATFIAGALAVLPLELVPAINHWMVAAALSCLIDLTAAWGVMLFVAAYFATAAPTGYEPQAAATAVPGQTLPPAEVFPPSSPSNPSPFA